MPITKVRLLQRVGLFFVQPVCYAKKNVYLCIAFSVEGVIGRDVGIGRQDGLKIRWAVMPVWACLPQAGSSPTRGTKEGASCSPFFEKCIMFMLYQVCVATISTLV